VDDAGPINCKVLNADGSLDQLDRLAAAAASAIGGWAASSPSQTGPGRRRPILLDAGRFVLGQDTTRA
jgi:hypothetical protein